MNYMDESAVCPFYIEGEPLRIRCEGYNKKTRLHVSFKDKETQKEHTKMYCNNLECYVQCPLYSVIMNQYIKKETYEQVP